MPDWLAGALIAFGIALAATPAGISGAVFLLPVQASVLGVSNPALTPTNLLYNVLATPGGLLRFARMGLLRTPLTRALLAGSVPGVAMGAVIRVELLSGRRLFLLLIAALLAPLGVWLLRTRTGLSASRLSVALDDRPAAWISPLAGVVGVIGGVYGIGGGSLLAPLLAGAGYPLAAIAPAALASTFATSIVGVVTFQVLELLHGGSAIAPQWLLGLALGGGGMLGSYAGATLQPRLPERALRTLLGCVSLVVALVYAGEALVA